MTNGLSPAALASLARSTPEQVASLTRLGLLHPISGGYATGDAHRVRLVEAFAAAGVPAEALARADAQGMITLDYYDQLHLAPDSPSARTYGELLADLDERAEDLRSVFESCGIAEPELGDRLGESEEQLLLAILDALEASRDADLILRALHVFGATARHGSEAAMSVYAEAVDRVAADIARLPPTATFERFIEPWARFARLVPELSAWLHARHLSVAIDAWSVEETERQLARVGIVPERPSEPPAIAFVDLTGFTRLVEQVGDREAARVAMEFTVLASQIAEAKGGRLVKQLGDGVLLRFQSAQPAVEATLDLLEAMESMGLPRGHGGIEAGPVVVRDGDVFGRTVNLAARIADHATAGQLLTTLELATSLEAGRFSIEPVGRVSLQGISQPLDLARIWRQATWDEHPSS